MRVFKAICILFSFLLFLAVAGLSHIVITFVRPSYRWHWMSRLTIFLMKVLNSILGLKIHLQGLIVPNKERGQFIISRHLGYLDGLVLGSLYPAIFVSKKEIKRWPLIGMVVAVSGTIFIDRVHKERVFDSIRQIIERLRRKNNVFVFPEGTSTDGSLVKPFQTVFFHAPIAAKADIIPVTIQYRFLDGVPFGLSNRDEICWYGGMNFFKHLWNLLRYRRIDVEVTVHEKIETVNYESNSAHRKKLSQECYDLIAGATGLKARIPEGNPFRNR